MPTYVVLGATGAAGTSVLRHLLTRAPAPSTRLRLCVRSSKKLLLQNPGIATRPDVAIFEATLDQKAVLARAIRGADYIFACTGDNESPPQLSVSRDTAHAIGYALESAAPTSTSTSTATSTTSPSQQQGPTSHTPPTVVMLSSACLSPSPAPSPLHHLLRTLLRTALANSVADLCRAESHYRTLAARGLLRVVFAQPGSLMAAPVPTGHALCTTRSSSLMLGYADLGPGMVEMAERAAECGYAGRAVGVCATGRVRATPGPLVRYFVSGVVARCWPGVWPGGRRVWRRVRAAWSGLEGVEGIEHGRGVTAAKADA